MTNELKGYADHLVPIDETGTDWHQIAEIPVKHITQTDFHKTVSVEHLWYLYDCVELAVNVAGSTLQEAEAKMRKSLVFDLILLDEMKSGKISVSPNIKDEERAREVSQYFISRTQ